MPAFFLLRINDHLQYLSKVKATLDGKGDFRGTDHHSCRLGTWMDSTGPRDAAEVGPDATAILRLLYEPHERFHGASGRALQYQASGHRAEQEWEVTEMHRLSARLVDLLLQLDGLGKGTA